MYNIPSIWDTARKEQQKLYHSIINHYKQLERIAKDKNKGVVMLAYLPNNSEIRVTRLQYSEDSYSFVIVGHDVDGNETHIVSHVTTVKIVFKLLSALNGKDSEPVLFN
jgi:hypothetical protein